MGEVFRARDRDLQRDVAIKFLPARYASDADRLARFAQEARAASGLNHPNIITIHEIGEALGQPYIVMELVDGRTLRDEIEHAPLPAKRAIEYAAQIAEGLSKAHAAGIVHRDLKPENVMVTKDGFVKVLDFGLAKLRSEEAEVRGGGLGRGSDEDVTRATPATLDGAIVGTVGYMSPEQAAGQPAGFQADQFSLGAILYELATGRRAFARKTTVQTLSAILESEPPPLHEVNPSFPPPARCVVERCLAKNPADRYASTVDLAHQLRSVRDHFAEASSGPSISDRASPKPRRRVRVWHGVAVTLVAIAGLLFVPAISDLVLEQVRMLPLPAEKRLAVLPIHNPGGTAEDHAICEGLQDYVAARLGELDRFHGALWVVPAAEVLRSGVRTDGAAGRGLGVNLALDITVQRVAGRSVMSATLFDTARRRVLRAVTRNIASDALLLDQTVDAIVEMLDIELGDDARRALKAGTTAVAEASTLYAQALAYNPYEQAHTALERYDQRHNLEQAVTLLNAALERDPRYALAHAGLGEAYLRLWSLTREPEYVGLAEQHSRRAVEMDPLVAQAWLTLGSLHAQTGKPDEALADFQRAQARDPGSAEVVRERAAALERLRRFDEAERDYQAAITLRPSAWAAYSYYGVFLTKRGRHKEAETVLRRALTLAPDNARLWSSLGVALYGEGRLEDAEAAWKRSIAIQPSAAATSNLATRLYYTGHYADAARGFEKAVELSPLDYRVWRNLGSAYDFAPGEQSRASGAYRKAIDLAERERALDPQNPLLLGALAACLARTGEGARAQTLIVETTRLDPTNPTVASDAAGVYEDLGNRAMALRWLDQALRSGYSRTEIEHSPTFDRLRADPRYAKIGQPEGKK